ncbi:MAG: hypothetical protein AAF682_01880 [Planctomycetota bacterium]
MNLDELENELRMRQKGRRKERMVLGGCVLALALAVAAAVYFLRP